jgi:hypothetical protein
MPSRGPDAPPTSPAIAREFLWQFRRLGLVGRQQPLAALLQAPGRRRAGQGDDPATLVLGQPPRSAGSWPVAEPVDALGVEPVQPLPHRLRVAAQLGGDLGGAQAVPAVGDHPGAPDPVAGCVPGAGQLADGALFGGVDRWSGEQQDGHGGSLPGAHHRAAVDTSTPPIPTLRNVALMLRSLDPVQKDWFHRSHNLGPTVL